MKDFKLLKNTDLSDFDFDMDTEEETFQKRVPRFKDEVSTSKKPKKSFSREREDYSK